MAKKTRYVCSECGYVSPQWLGKCPGCNQFATLIEEIEETTVNQPIKKSSSFTKPVKINEVQKEKLIRFSSGIGELDTVLGGGIVPSSLVLVGGDPGIGKSTLLTQVAINLSKHGNKVLYVSAEESVAQLKLRCDRIDSDCAFMALHQNNLEDIISASEGYEFLIVDSIQAIYCDDLNSSIGSVSQVKECATRLMKFAKSTKTTVFIIGHVTKEGAIAGPKVLEHIMDTVLYFEGEPQDNYKLLRSVKNRFGSSQEIGIFEMTDKGIFGVDDTSGIFISDEIGKNAGSVITPSLSGNRCMLVELQCLLCKTVFGMPRRMPLGIDYNKLIVMLAVLEKRAYMPLFTQDCYVNAMGGIKINEPSVDLAIICAVASANKEIAIEKSTAILGEVGLTGEIRAVTQIEKRINECIKRGIKKIILPSANLKNLSKFSEKVELKGVKHVYEVIKYLFG